MTQHETPAADLALHGPRVLGFASAARVADRFGLDVGETGEHLLDHEATGFVVRSEFAGTSGWSLTDRGRAENERRLAAELDRTGTRPVVTAAHERFLPLNRRLLRACTKWQLRPTRDDPMAFNDHTDWAWDENVVRTLTAVGRDLADLCAPLAASLRRFDGYAERYAAALAAVDAGQRRWVDSPDVDSCHTVWIQLHEDLLATLGIPRGADS